MSVRYFPRIASLVREKNVKLHLQHSKVSVTQNNVMILAAPVFGQGLWGTFHEQGGTEFGRFRPNKSFRKLIEEDPQKAQAIINDIEMVEKGGLKSAMAISRLTGNCFVCGRTLTNESSIEEGIGPICSGKVGSMW